MKLNRREFLAATSAVLAARPAAAEPQRLKRKDCFFGLHFDLHPQASDTALGSDLTDAMVAHLLERVRPDFVQYDSKGVPGYLGFPSKTGMSAPGIVKDSLAIWRRLTAAHGVALYNHFCGVLDALAVTRHPEWACVGRDGKREPGETSLYSAYEQQLMIPELMEVAQKYDLDGSWVDAECWAVTPDYCEAAQRQFRAETGIETLPKAPGDKGWSEFLDMQREQFRKHVALYVDALHRARPGYQITSNWMYSILAPERPTLPLDFLSGDLADETVRRIAARYFPRCGKPWDLMSWGFATDEKFQYSSDRPAAELEQEAAIVLAQGGAYQIYYQPTRGGWIDDRIVATAATVAAFCRERQRWSFRSESLPEVGVFFSGRTLYRTAWRPFGPFDGSGATETPAVGAVDLLLSSGYSVDLIPDWQVAESAAQYPLIVVPDWQDIGGEAAATLVAYTANGGKLLLFGAANARLFSSGLNLQLTGEPQTQTYYVADDSGFAQVTGDWIGLGGRTIASAYPALDTRKDAVPIAALIQHGKGTAVVCPGPIPSSYATADTPILRSLAKQLLQPLCAPIVTMDGDFPELEIVLRKKDGQTLVHFINIAGAPATSQSRHQGIVPRTGPIRLRVRLPHAPSRVVLEPEGTALTGEYKGGEWHGLLPDLHIHSILRIVDSA